MLKLARDAYLPLIKLALAEDLGRGDVTSLSVIPESLVWSACMVTREPLVAAGMEVFCDVYREIDSTVECVSHVNDGTAVPAGETLMTLKGRAVSILSGERVALNFSQRLSGIATLTQRYVAALEGLPCRILDTRKTTPGWRALEKYAVSCGGGHNHRMGLFDMVMIKDNHLAVLADEVNPIAVAVERARKKFPECQVEVEADKPAQAEQAAVAGADFVLLDNMSLDEMRESIALIRGRAATEASGGITLDTIRAVAETGVDSISVGALTHSAHAVDLALDIEAGNVS